MKKIFKIKLNRHKQLIHYPNLSTTNTGCGCGNNKINTSILENKINNKKEKIINNLNSRKIFI